MSGATPGAWLPKPGEIVAVICESNSPASRTIRLRPIERATESSAWVDGDRYLKPRGVRFGGKDVEAVWERHGSREGSTYFRTIYSIARLTPALRAEHAEQRRQRELVKLRNDVAGAALASKDAEVLQEALRLLGGKSVAPGGLDDAVKQVAK